MGRTSCTKFDQGGDAVEATRGDAQMVRNLTKVGMR